VQKFPSSYAAGSPEEAQALEKDKTVARMLFGKKNDHAFDAREHIGQIPTFQQTQRALDEQLRDLMPVANALGMYDAADFLRSKVQR